MSNRDFTNDPITDLIIADPVAYLAELGVEAELIGETVLPAAA